MLSSGDGLFSLSMFNVFFLFLARHASANSENSKFSAKLVSFNILINKLSIIFIQLVLILIHLLGLLVIH